MTVTESLPFVPLPFASHSCQDAKSRPSSVENKTPTPTPSTLLRRPNTFTPRLDRFAHTFPPSLSPLPFPIPPSVSRACLPLPLVTSVLFGSPAFTLVPPENGVRQVTALKCFLFCRGVRWLAHWLAGWQVFRKIKRKICMYLLNVCVRWG